MSEGPGFLEFFILEASDYVEQLDGLLLGSSSNGPDADAIQRVARALRRTRGHSDAGTSPALEPTIHRPRGPGDPPPG